MYRRSPVKSAVINAFSLRRGLAVPLAVRHEDASFTPFSFTPSRTQNWFRGFDTSSGHDEEVADPGTQVSSLVQRSFLTRILATAAVELPTELLRDVFLLLCVEDLPLANKYQKYPPTWASITYVCRRWRVVALSFQQLWSTVTPDLSPKWVLAFLKRSSHRPLRVCLNVGPVHKRPLRKRVRLGPRTPAAFLPDQTIRKVLSHAPRIQELQVSGKGEDVIRILKSLDKPAPLDSLVIRVRDGYCRDISPSGTPLTLPHAFLGGHTLQLRHLHCWSGLHLTFPPWLLGSISELTVSMDFSLDRLFVVLGQTPQLKTLRISSSLTHFRQSDRALTPIHLNCLSSLVLETNSLGLFTTISTTLLLPPGVRRHFTLTLTANSIEGRSWSSFLSSLKAILTTIPGSLHGIHFKWQRGTTYFYAWAMPVESLLSPSPWPPLDDVFSLQVRGPSSSFGFGCHSQSLNPFHSHDPSFHRLQELCVFLGRETVKELSVEYGMEGSTSNPFQILHHCWGTLLSGLPNITTLRFGDGAAHLLLSASCGSQASPPELGRGNFPNLRRVQVTHGSLSGPHVAEMDPIRHRTAKENEAPGAQEACAIPPTEAVLRSRISAGRL
ncbi:hypothetical protein EDB83DRAFT_2648885 [Lactarius deliciosus]|nr:hypothetical protein EDB83DRAFT_2648885 [Lactarius deliciosus]